MQASVMIDGSFVPVDRAVVSVFDRGFLYGDSVFESLRSYGGRLFALDEHLARLEASAERVFIPLPVTIDELRGEVLETVKAEARADCYVRITITRGSARSLGLDPGTAGPALRVVLATELQAPPEALYEQGIAAITFRAERVSDATGLAAAKIGNYLTAVLALRAAREQGAREALIVDGAGRILEGSTSNVFAVIDGKLVTPGEEHGILPGITRRHVLEIAQRSGLPIELRPLSPAEFRHAGEVFITSSIRELVPVTRVDGHEVSGGAPGPVTRALLTAYRELVRG